MRLYVIRKYYNGAPSDFLVGARGRMTFTNKRAAEREAKRVKSLQYLPSRDYRVELIEERDA